MIDEIDDLSEDNYEAFKAKLKLDKVMKDIEVKYHDYTDFVKNKKAMEEQKSNDLNRAIDQMYDILQKFNKERKWKTDVEHSMLKDPKDHDILLKKLCREETERLEELRKLFIHEFNMTGEQYDREVVKPSKSLLGFYDKMKKRFGLRGWVTRKSALD
jgi:hypothetical protein